MSSTPPSSDDERLEALLARARQAAKSLPVPSLERLEAYVAGQLTPEEVTQVEQYLALNPDYAALVETLRHPDPVLTRAYHDKLAELVAADMPRPGLLERLRQWWSLPAFGGAALVAAAVMVWVSLRPSMNLPDHGVDPLVTQGLMSAPGNLPLTVLSVGERYSLPTGDAGGALLVLESRGTQLEVLQTPVAVPGAGVRFLFLLSGALEPSSVLEALRPLLQAADFQALTEEARRTRVLEALRRAQLEPTALTVSKPFRVE